MNTYVPTFESYMKKIIYRGERDPMRMKDAMPGMHYTKTEDAAKLMGGPVHTYEIMPDANIVSFFSEEAMPIVSLWNNGNDNEIIYAQARESGIDGIDYEMGDIYGIVMFDNSKLRRL